MTTLLGTAGRLLMLIEPTASHFNNDDGSFLPSPQGTFSHTDRNVSEAIFAAHGGSSAGWPVLNRQIPRGWSAAMLRDEVTFFLFFFFFFFFLHRNEVSFECMAGQ